ncbi:MAG: tripartite tricarboxylate transporter substrate binding protein [Burkholderiales bacterium]|nr:tripartite tricarboxylate transporter substrate binding protein [Burkholderiales bacterium]
MRGTVWMAAAAAAGAVFITSAGAQTWPAKPIRIYTSAAGGPYDLVIRAMTPGLNQALGQPLVVENRTGANYVPLGQACTRAEADGYELCIGDIYIVSMNPHAFSRAPYQLSDFTPIAFFGYLPAALIVHPSVKAATVQELFALAKAKTGAVTFGTPGPATNSSMYVQYFAKQMGIHFLDVPYKSFVQALQAVVAGEVNATIFGLGASLRMVKAGKARALAVTGEKRSYFAPDIPTILEAGVDINISNWGGFLGPAGLPRPIVTRLNAEIGKLIGAPIVRKALEAQTFEQAPPSGGTPEQFAAFLKAEDAKFQRIVSMMGLRLD